MTGSPGRGPTGDDVPSQPVAALLRWFADHGRHDLPWRATRDPWAVLAAEVMLQQTQVARVLPRWAAFLERFPTPADAAAAGPAALIECWSGLGYNRRAVMLWRAADEVTRTHGGRFPTDLAGLLALPGVGPYTARAVLAFAFEHDVGVVDTNAARVLARRHGRRLGGAEVQRLADDAVPRGHGWAWNQAMLDLGATVCTSRRPGCERCPWQQWCRWAAAGGTEDPAAGSAGVSGGQSAFEGSDRQGRGRLVAALRRGPVPFARVPAAMGWPDDGARARRVADGLVVDGLALVDDEGYRLPG